MNSNTQHSNVNSQSSHSVHSLPSSLPFRRKEELLQPIPQHRPHAVRHTSYNPHRLSHAPMPQYFHGVNDTMVYSHHDPSRLSTRYSMGHQIGPDVFRRSYSGNLSSMLPSDPSFQHPNPRDQKRATLQPHAHLADPRAGVNSNRASRVEPKNLIHSFRNSTPSNQPRSADVRSRRVVTGVLQSALPPSARPPPIETAPPRSMPIGELERRHKAALQKLQTHTNNRTAQLSAAAAPKPVKPQQRPSAQAKSESVSDGSSRSEKDDKSAKAAFSRRSFFSFLISKDENKKSSSTPEEPARSKQRLSSKKHKEPPKPANSQSDEEDEDVPLAQLRNRRASYNPASQTLNTGHSRNLDSLNNRVLTKSFSVPVDVNKPQDRVTIPLDATATDESRRRGIDPIHYSKYTKSITHSGIRSKRASTHLESIGGLCTLDSLTPSDHLSSGTSNSPTWLQANFELSNEEKNGPRPLIFEDEAKAIRNSKRLWAQ